MARKRRRLTKAQRYNRTAAAAERAQLRGETSPTKALRAYRKHGGSARTQDWYQAWKGKKQAIAEPPTAKPEQRTPGQWWTNVGVVWLDTARGVERTHWHTVKTPPGRRQRMSDEDAIETAINRDQSASRQYKLRLLYAYVSSYE